MSTQVMNNANAKQKMRVRTIVQTGMLGAIAVVLMLFEIPLPFAPSFYEIDFSEVPVLVGSFAMGGAFGAGTAVGIALALVLVVLLVRPDPYKNSKVYSKRSVQAA